MRGAKPPSRCSSSSLDISRAECVGRDSRFKALVERQNRSLPLTPDGCIKSSIMGLLPWILAACIVLVSRATGAAQPSPSGAIEPVRLALVIKYADGRSTTQLVGRKPASMWTPEFPRRPVAPVRPSPLPPIWALQFAQALEGEEARVTVSLLVHDAVKQIDVATVTVARGGEVPVDALREYGIESVTLSLIDVAPVMPFMPTLESVTPDLRFDAAEVIAAPNPAYRITLRNLSSVAVANVHVQTYRGTQKATSSLPVGVHGQPLMRPGGQYVLTVAVTGGRIGPNAKVWSPEPLDRIVIDSVLWDDGTTTGAQSRAFAMIPVEAGQRLQLVRIVEIFREALSSPAIDLAAIERRLRALPDSDATLLASASQASRDTKTDALQMVQDYRRTASATATPAAVRRWVTTSLQRYEQQVEGMLDR